jgi:hypothetical protein
MAKRGRARRLERMWREQDYLHLAADFFRRSTPVKRM